jgi:hypothetical protein
MNYLVHKCAEIHLWNLLQSLEDLNIEADRLITHSMAANTWKTYKTAVDSINEFRHIYALSNSWPIALEILYLSVIKTSFLTKFITLGDLDDFLFKIVTTALLSILNISFLFSN